MESLVLTGNVDFDTFAQKYLKHVCRNISNIDFTIDYINKKTFVIVNPYPNFNFSNVKDFSSLLSCLKNQYEQNEKDSSDHNNSEADKFFVIIPKLLISHYNDCWTNVLKPKGFGTGESVVMSSYKYYAANSYEILEHFIQYLQDIKGIDFANSIFNISFSNGCIHYNNLNPTIYALPPDITKLLIEKPELVNMLGRSENGSRNIEFGDMACGMQFYNMTLFEYQNYLPIATKNLSIIGVNINKASPDYGNIAILYTTTYSCYGFCAFIIKLNCTLSDLLNQTETYISQLPSLGPEGIVIDKLIKTIILTVFTKSDSSTESTSFPELYFDPEVEYKPDEILEKFMKSSGLQENDDGYRNMLIMTIKNMRSNSEELEDPDVTPEMCYTNLLNDLEAQRLERGLSWKDFSADMITGFCAMGGICRIDGPY